jgi:cytosine/adenosine deaminase-related metal-dependent hydrolase
MLGMEDRLGSITPGKQADLVILDARLLNMPPVLDPINTVVTQTGIVNVEAVLTVPSLSASMASKFLPTCGIALAS